MTSTEPELPPDKPPDLAPLVEDLGPPSLVPPPVISEPRRSLRLVNKKSTTKGSFGLIEYKPPKLNYVPVVNTTAGAEYIELPVSATEALAHHDL